MKRGYKMKTKNTEQNESILSIRLPADIRRWVDDEAKRVGVKSSTWIRMLLIQQQKEIHE